LQEDFDRYFINYYCGKYDDIFIQCYNSQKNYKVAGYIDFYPDSTKWDPGLVNGVIHLCYPKSHFNDIINIIRYEKPLSLIVDPQNKYGYIATAIEPVGEQEGV